MVLETVNRSVYESRNESKQGKLQIPVQAIMSRFLAATMNKFYNDLLSVKEVKNMKRNPKD